MWAPLLQTSTIYEAISWAILLPALAASGSDDSPAKFFPLGVVVGVLVGGTVLYFRKRSRKDL
jgi:hypothetical protein